MEDDNNDNNDNNTTTIIIGDVMEEEWREDFRYASWLYRHARNDYESGGLEASKRGFVTAGRAFLDYATHFGQEEVELYAAGCYIYIGAIAHRQRRLEEALQYCRCARRIYERLEPGSLSLATACNNMGGVWKDMSQPQEALTCFQKAQEIEERLEPGSLELACTYQSTAGILCDVGRLTQALDHYHMALAIQERLAPDSADLAWTMTGIGSVLVDQGDHVMALAWFTRAQTIHQQLQMHDKDNQAPVLATIYNQHNIASVMRAQGRLLDALALHREANATRLELASNNDDRDSLDLAASCCNMGDILRQLGRTDEAMAFLEQDRRITERLMPDSLDLSMTWNALGCVLKEMGRFDEALTVLRKAQRIVERLAPESIQLACVLMDTASVLCHLQPERALDLVRQAQDMMLQPHVGILPTNPMYHQANYLETYLCHSMGDEEGATRCRQRILSGLPGSEAALDRLVGNESWRTLEKRFETEAIQLHHKILLQHKTMRVATPVATLLPCERQQATTS